MIEIFAQIANALVLGLEAVGIVVILAGFVLATVNWLLNMRSRSTHQAYRDYRRRSVRGLIPGLQLLVAAVPITVNRPLPISACRSTLVTLISRGPAGASAATENVAVSSLPLIQSDEFTAIPSPLTSTGAPDAEPGGAAVGRVVNTAGSELRSAQLAVLAAAAIVAAGFALLFVQLRLTVDAQANPRYGIAAGLRDGFTAFLALASARTLRQAGANALDGILDGAVDLVLYRAIARPTTGHVELLLAFPVWIRGYPGSLSYERFVGAVTRPQ